MGICMDKVNSVYIAFAKMKIEKKILIYSTKISEESLQRIKVEFAKMEKENL